MTPAFFPLAFQFDKTSEGAGSASVMEDSSWDSIRGLLGRRLTRYSPVGCTFSRGPTALPVPGSTAEFVQALGAG